MSDTSLMWEIFREWLLRVTVMHETPVCGEMTYQVETRDQINKEKYIRW